MEELQPGLQAVPTTSEELLYFWALGDLHYFAQPGWQAIHTPRMSRMFQDLRQLWTQEGLPTFCVSPGDIVEIAEPEHYQLAGEQLRLNLHAVPFYPGLGNHELFTKGEESETELMNDFTTFWSRPPHYYWVQGEVLCVMLDAIGYGVPRFSHETLAFLETALAKYPQHIAILFAHCPLYNTVLTREAPFGQDYHSLEPFFSIENSDAVRAILARHSNACLYLSGHTHSGWQSPNLVMTEQLGGHPVTHVNLSSPWYTGRHHGAEWLAEEQRFHYRADQPDYLASLAVHVSREQIHLRLRDHNVGDWLATWNVPVK
ncbi:MAG TPA: metallophosphoesterase [Ktedonobacteraceae bacterium]|jgi:hypothetical protein